MDDGLRVVDYKTGQAPASKAYYSDELKADLRAKSLFQLRIYAWLLEARRSPDDADVDAVSSLRLLYLGGDEAVAVDEAVPSDPDERRRVMDRVEADLADVWKRIHAKVAANDPANDFDSCDRAWCFCHVARPLCFPTGDAESEKTSVESEPSPPPPPPTAAAAADEYLYEKKTVSELKALLKERGLKVSGKKAELVGRLRTAGGAPHP